MCYRNKSGDIWENRIFRTTRSQDRAGSFRPQGRTDFYFSSLTAKGKTDPLTRVTDGERLKVQLKGLPRGLIRAAPYFSLSFEHPRVRLLSRCCVEIQDMRFSHWSTSIERKSYSERVKPIHFLNFKFPRDTSSRIFFLYMLDVNWGRLY